MKRIIFLILFLLLNNSVSCSLIIKLKDKAEVKGDKIYLRDISFFSNQKLENLEIGKSAFPGHFRIIQKDYLTSRLKLNKVQDFQIVGSNSVKVFTMYSEVKGEDILNYAKEFVLSKLKDEEVEINSNFKMRNLITPYGKVELKIEDDIPHLIGFTPISVKIIANNKFYKTVRVNLNIKILKSVFITKKEIKKGEKINNEEVIIEKKDISKLPKDIVFDLSLFKEKVAKRLIPSQSVLRESYFEDICLVKKGDEVIIFVNLGNLEISTQGKSLSSGKIGEIIKVLNLDSKKELQAKVIGEKKVEVIF